MTIRVQVVGINEIKNLDKTTRNIPKNFQNIFLDEAGKFGVGAVKRHVPRGNRPDSLRKDVIHNRESTNVEVVRFADPRQQLIANYNEFGVLQHRRNIRSDPELLRWAQMKIPDFVARGGNLIWIGGPNSHIKKGASQNKFVDKSVIDIYNNLDLISKNTWKRVKNK